MYTEIIEKEPGQSYRTRIVTFDSIYEFAKIKDTPRCLELWSGKICRRFRDGGAEDWFGEMVTTEADLLRVLEHGDKIYTDLVLGNQVIAPPPQSIKRRAIFGDYGDELDIHKVNSGDNSTAWRRRSPRARIGVKNIRLLVNLSQSCGVGASKSKWVGIAALAIADGLEIAGYNVAIDAVMGSRGVTNKESCAFVVPIKPYDAPLDITGLSAATCFPGFWRGPGFMNFGLTEGDIDSGLGHTYFDSDIEEQIMDRYYKNPAEVVHLISNEVRDASAVKEQIKKVFDTLEIKDKAA